MPQREALVPHRESLVPHREALLPFTFMYLTAQRGFAVGGLLIVFKVKFTKIKKKWESGRIMPLKQRIWGKINLKTKKVKINL